MVNNKKLLNNSMRIYVFCEWKVGKNTLECVFILLSLSSVQLAFHSQTSNLEGVLNERYELKTFMEQSSIPLRLEI